MTENIRKTLYKSAKGEYTEKKSRFIASLAYVESQEEAEEFFAKIRKEYYDARHNCTAYIIENGESIQKRSSDDGEPQGTAGHPMLDVLENEGIVNIAAVVTRYFGGTLLGTGGLVRSYTKAVQDALENSEIIERQQGTEVTLKVDYQSIGKMEYFLASYELVPIGKNYGEDVEIKLAVPDDKMKKLREETDRITGGKGKIAAGERIDFAVYEGTLLTGSGLVCDTE